MFYKSKYKDLLTKNDELEKTIQKLNFQIRCLEHEKDFCDRLTSVFDLWKKLQETGVTYYKTGDMEIKK